MKKIITKPALRIKITGACNRTCSFCNEEGDMHSIRQIEPDEVFFDCIHSLTETLGIERVMLTGGEPTIHPDLSKIVKGINVPEISITSNGIRPLDIGEWIKLRDAGLRKVIISIHDETPQSFIQLETRKRDFSWAVRALESQKNNLITASLAGLKVRVNVVAYSSQEQVLRVLNGLEDLQQKHMFDIRLLNDLANIEKSQQIIRNLCQSLGAKTIKEIRRAGSSNSTTVWKTDSGFSFSTKMAYRYFFGPICTKCLVKEDCYEGFYGIRIERRMSDYWVRLCIYKHSSEVLMPWNIFLKSDLSQEFKKLCKREQK